MEFHFDTICTSLPILLEVLGIRRSDRYVSGRAMVLGSFQCRGALLYWHLVGQVPAVLAAGAGWVSCFLEFFYLIYPIFLF